jgi:hypothetical protein
VALCLLIAVLGGVCLLSGSVLDGGCSTTTFRFYVRLSGFCIFFAEPFFFLFAFDWISDRRSIAFRLADADLSVSSFLVTQARRFSG